MVNVVRIATLVAATIAATLGLTPHTSPTPQTAPTAVCHASAEDATISDCDYRRGPDGLGYYPIP